MTPRKDIILFTDLETTGNEDEDCIIEVGISAIETKGLTEVGAYSIIVQPTESARARIYERSVVEDMHRANGLLQAVEDGMGFLPDEADTLISNWITDQFGGRTLGHIPLAGSGVLHFDRKYIRKWLPRFDRRLTYWAYDVGVLRRMFVFAGKSPAPIDAKTHRALDDARVHAEEFRFYADFVKRGAA